MNQISLFKEDMYLPQSLSEIVYDSDNVAGVPMLDINRQAEKIVAPHLVWGSIARSEEMLGTYSFYCDDYKFSGLWNDPDKLVRSGCAVAIECNCSVGDRLPVAVALYRTFQKRWLSRYWQMQGIALIVDMNVAIRHENINLLGVPNGWRSYATRLHKGRFNQVEQHYKTAVNHAATKNILFIVYGGGYESSIALSCVRNGWYHIPDKRRALDVDKYDA